MGYTQYFPYLRLPTTEEWATVVARTDILLRHLPEHTDSAGGYFKDRLLRLAWEEDVNLPPQVGPDTIRFNGSRLKHHYAAPEPDPLTVELLYPDEDKSKWTHGSWEEEFGMLNDVPPLPQTQSVDQDDVGSHEEDLGHETFVLHATIEMSEDDKKFWGKTRPYGYQCCKTARKPYDLAVCGVLLVAHAVAPGWMDIRSDGEVSEWLPALLWVNQVLGQDGTRYQLPPGVTRYND